MGKKQQSKRSRDERQRAARELEFESNKSSHIDGKTKVQDKVAELSVRGIIGENEDATAKDKKKPLMVPGASSSGGISKKKKLNHKQKKRQAQAMERAEQIMEQRSKKVEDSVNQLQKIRQRKKPWEQFEEEVTKLKSKQVNANKFDQLADDES